MLIKINDRVQVESSQGVDFKPDETYGNKIVIDGKELLIKEEIANSIETDVRPDGERPIETLHRRSGDGWNYVRLSSAPIAEMMAKGSNESIAGIMEIKMIGLAFCVETGADTILMIYQPVGMRSDGYDEYYSTFQRIAKAAKALVINGQKLNLAVSDSNETADKIRPVFGKAIEEHISIAPVIEAKIPLNITFTSM